MFSLSFVDKMARKKYTKMISYSTFFTFQQWSLYLWPTNWIGLSSTISLYRPRLNRCLLEYFNEMWKVQQWFEGDVSFPLLCVCPIRMTINQAKHEYNREIAKIIRHFLVFFVFIEDIVRCSNNIITFFFRFGQGKNEWMNNENQIFESLRQTHRRSIRLRRMMC